MNKEINKIHYYETIKVRLKTLKLVATWVCRVFYPGWEFQRFALAREIRIATLFFKYKKNSKDIVYRPNYKL